MAALSPSVALVAYRVQTARFRMDSESSTEEDFATERPTEARDLVASATAIVVGLALTKS